MAVTQTEDSDGTSRPGSPEWRQGQSRSDSETHSDWPLPAQPEVIRHSFCGPAAARPGAAVSNGFTHTQILSFQTSTPVQVCRAKFKFAVQVCRAKFKFAVQVCRPKFKYAVQVCSANFAVGEQALKMSVWPDPSSRALYTVTSSSPRRQSRLSGFAREPPA